MLPKAIESATAQTYADKVIVVFDDASTDGTPLLQKEYPAVHWIVSAIPRGLMYARNLFLDFEKAELFCSLDDDAWFLSNQSLEVAIAYLAQNPSVGAIAFDILSPDDHPDKKRDATVSYHETNLYIGCGHILRIDCAKQAGGYLKSPGFYGSEEKDLCIRLIDQGYSIVKAQGLYVWHDKTTVSRDIGKQHRSGVCNDLVFTYRRAPWMFLLPVLAYKFLSHFRFSLFYKKAKLIRPCLQGFFDFIKFLFSSNKQRQPVSAAAYKKFMQFN